MDSSEQNGKLTCPKCTKLKQLVEKQAEDWSLWGPAKPCGEEAQKALRLIHAFVEDEEWSKHFYAPNEKN